MSKAMNVTCLEPQPFLTAMLISFIVAIVIVCLWKRQIIFTVLWKQASEAHRTCDIQFFVSKGRSMLSYM